MNGIVSKTIVAEKSPEVQILLPPPNPRCFKMFFKNKQKEPENIKEILTSFKEISSRVKKLEIELKEIKESNKLAIQGVGIVRFNPFPEIGGNQSFSLALVNHHNNGVVITSYYSREGSSVYSKEIKNGKSEYPLLKEEQEAIEIACSQEDKKKKI